MTPAMAAGVTTKLLDVADLVELLVEAEQKSRVAVGERLAVTRREC